MTTMRDIAKLSKVSVSTVSRVLSGKGRVSAEKRNEIIKLANQFHYIPNYHAKCMTKTGVITVGLVVPDISNPFFSKITMGIEAELRDNALLILMNSFRDIEREKRLSLLLRDNGAKGIIIGNSHVEDDFVFEISKYIPVVVFDKEYNLPNISTIKLDNVYGAYLATNHLIEIGCSSIVHFGGFDDLDVSIQRREGYKKALRRGMQPYVIPTGYDERSGYEKAKKILTSKKFDGVFCMNDLVAIGVLKAAKEMGIRVPEDLKIIGFDDTELCEVVTPPLSSIHQPIEEMGRAAARALLKMIEGEESTRSYLFSPSLIVRSSTLSIRGDRGAKEEVR